MWIEIVACLDDNLRECLCSSLFAPIEYTRDSQSFDGKTQYRKVFREGLSLFALMRTTEFEVEHALNFKPQTAHRLIKQALFHEVSERISFEDFGIHNARVLSGAIRERLREVDGRLRQLPRQVAERPSKRISDEEGWIKIEFDDHLYETAIDDLSRLVVDLLALIPRVEPQITARRLAHDTFVADSFVEEWFKEGTFLQWIVVPRIRYETLYEETLIRGLIRMRQEIIEAPIMEGQKFNTRNAALVLSAIKFLDERTRANVSLHLHQHGKGDAPGKFKSIEAAVTDRLQAVVNTPRIENIDEMNLNELVALEKKLDEEKI